MINISTIKNSDFLSFTLLSIVVLSMSSLSAEVYYIDFEDGNDSNSGTSENVAWKHCPGDSNATGVVANKDLSPGDILKFKGGVVYRGSISVNWSGSDSNPVVYDGNSASDYGEGRAIIDGSTIISTPWVQCTNAEDAGGNPNWENIYYTSVPDGIENGWPQILMDGTTQLHLSQESAPSNPWLFDDAVNEWMSTHQSNVSSTTLSDSTYFNQPNSTDWQDAWIGMRAYGNSMQFRPIMSYDPSSSRVTFAPSINRYTDKETYFAVFNHVRMINGPGKTAISKSQNRMYVWPPDSGNMEEHVWSYGNELYAFGSFTRSNVTIKGFHGRGFFMDVGEPDGGAFGIIRNTSNPGTGGGRNIVYEDNLIEFCISMERVDLIVSSTDTGMVVRDNTLRYSFAGGIAASWGSHIVEGNHIHDITGTGIFLQKSINSRVSNNHVHDLIGTHANGISIYTDSKNVIVERNRVSNVNNLMTFEYSENLTFRNNIFDATGKDQRINEWGKMTGRVEFFNNTIVNSPSNRMLNIGVSSSQSAIYEIRNNIIDGGGVYAQENVTRSNNIYTGRHWWQESGRGWDLAPDEVDGSLSELFVSPENGDWSLKENSPAISSGLNLSTKFQDDYAGKVRSSLGSWDVGAVEFGSILESLVPLDPNGLGVVNVSF